MQVAAAFLCDAASVREGLLHVLGGGITRVWRQEFPGPMGMSVAMLLELHRQELNRPHELSITVMGEDGQSVAEVKGGFQAPANPNLEVHEGLLVPMTLDLRAAAIPAAGAYTVDISIDGEHRRSLRFSARPASELLEQQRQQRPPG